MNGTEKNVIPAKCQYFTRKQPFSLYCAPHYNGYVTRSQKHGDRVIKHILFGLSLIYFLFSTHAMGLELPKMAPQPFVEISLSPEQPKLHQLLNTHLANYFSESARHTLADERMFIQKILQSEGYYAFTLKLIAKTKPKQTSKTGRSYAIALGTRAAIETIDLAFPANIPPPSLSDLPVKAGSPLQAQMILDTQKWLQAYIQKNYCLVNTHINYTASLAPSTQLAEVTFSLNDDTQGVFGKIELIGNTRIHTRYLERILPYQKGGCYSASALDKTRIALLQTNLISTVNIKTHINNAQTTQQNADNIVNIDTTIHLTERAARTYKAGLSYSSDAKLGLLAGWEHRNLLGNAERLSFELDVNRINKDLTAQFTRPHFLVKNQTLKLTTGIETEETRTYHSAQGEARALIERQINAHLTASVGTAYARLEVESENLESNEKYDLLSLPIEFKLDHRNDLLNATNGWALTLSTQPFIDIYSTETQYFKNTISFSTFYSPFSNKRAATIALKIDSGSISGSTLDELPVPERFFVGGGGSVRGYQYQSLGVFENGSAQGGRSFGTASLELRTAVSENWGLAAFADGGYAYPEDMPQFGENFLWGAGLGIRYFTSFAPLRFDIAAPLDKRQGLDDDFQLYISIGQAF